MTKFFARINFHLAFWIFRLLFLLVATKRPAESTEKKLFFVIWLKSLAFAINLAFIEIASHAPQSLLVRLFSPRDWSHIVIVCYVALYLFFSFLFSNKIESGI